MANIITHDHGDVLEVRVLELPGEGEESVWGWLSRRPGGRHHAFLVNLNDVGTMDLPMRAALMASKIGLDRMGCRLAVVYNHLPPLEGPWEEELSFVDAYRSVAMALEALRGRKEW